MGLLLRVGAIILLIFLIYHIWKRWRSGSPSQPAASSAQAAPPQPSNSDTDLIRCHHCGTLAPRAQAITTSFGQIYCNTACLQQANQTHS
ncbi:MAG: hypothetical protein HQL58_05830 [Magnetococcales bacterium]|nr:hypothetical protein [Magnetococcales bacterium]